MDAYHLSRRLTAVAKYVPDGARLADIGSDHAYLPASLLVSGKISYAVAGEVVKGPYENEKKEIKTLGLGDRLKARLADGLAAINVEDHIDTVTIAGMGGSLIEEILSKNKERLAGVKRLVLQPNVGEIRVRQWLMDHGYQIMAEDILEEDGHTYEIICADLSTCPFRYDDRELLFGPFLLEQNSPVFQNKWQAELGRTKNAVSHMEQARERPVDKINQMNDKIAMIERILKK